MATSEELAAYAHEEAQREELELDILERLDIMRSDFGAKAIRAEAGMYSREISTCKDAIAEIQRLRKDLEQIHNFSHPARVGSRRFPLASRITR